MALYGLFCADVPLINYSLTVFTSNFMQIQSKFRNAAINRILQQCNAQINFLHSYVIGKMTG